ncbi:hypothetical protein LCGC14_0551800 [marine sediment metagenome]|uniref:Uncharacterized protein n=1 Tax=marine sediment metagenome TaxID=412755 RepID=A0A0F9UXW1_9ZZZZ
MSDLSQAVALVKGLGKQYRAVLAVSKALEGINNLDLAREKAERTTKDAIQAAAAAEAERIEVEKELDEANEALGFARSEAKKVLADGDAKARKAFQDAVAKGDKVIQEAKDKQEAIADKVSRDTKEHDLKMKRFKAFEDVAQAKLDAIQEEIDALKKRLG